MSGMASEITGVSIVCSTVDSCVDQRKHQSSASLAFARGIRRWPMNSPHKRPETRKMFPFDDVIMGVGGVWERLQWIGADRHVGCDERSAERTLYPILRLYRSIHHQWDMVDMAIAHMIDFNCKWSIIVLVWISAKSIVNLFRATVCGCVGVWCTDTATA